MKKKYECLNSSCSYYNHLNNFDDQLCSSCVFRKAINETGSETTIKLSKISYIKNKTQFYYVLGFLAIISIIVFSLMLLNSKTNILKKDNSKNLSQNIQQNNTLNNTENSFIQNTSSIVTESTTTTKSFQTINSASPSHSPSSPDTIKTTPSTSLHNLVKTTQLKGTSSNNDVTSIKKLTPSLKPTAISTTTPLTSTKVTTSTPITLNKYSIDYIIAHDWQQGATITINIFNNSTVPINNWCLIWTFNGNQSVTNFWNTNLIQTGKLVTAKNLNYNSVIPANGYVNLGFNIKYDGKNLVPTDLKIS